MLVSFPEFWSNNFKIGVKVGLFLQFWGPTNMWTLQNFGMTKPYGHTLCNISLWTQFCLLYHLKQVILTQLSRFCCNLAPKSVTNHSKMAVKMAPWEPKFETTLKKILSGFSQNPLGLFFYAIVLTNAEKISLLLQSSFLAYVARVVENYMDCLLITANKRHIYRVTTLVNGNL